MFDEKQITALSAPLNSSHVKSREQSGRKLSYVEGWHAIAEANRIFGFDGWSRETMDLKCVSEREREIGAAKHKGWGVTYTAQVRVRVGHIFRDGCGTGHGIDRDLGQAHESALKEAETDAMKRALMTFGNPFGLALYDKTQANVTDEKPHEDGEWGKPAAVKTYKLLLRIIQTFVTQPSDVFEFREKNGGMIANLPVEMRKHLESELDRIGGIGQEAAE